MEAGFLTTEKEAGFMAVIGDNKTIFAKTSI